MDDLIRRDKLCERLSEDTEEGTFLFSEAQIEAAYKILEYIAKIIMEFPPTEAVPLEPLCQWLAGYAAPPNYALDEVRDDSIDPESLVYTVNDRVKAWEFHFRELMKSGLMDTEGEDARP